MGPKEAGMDLNDIPIMAALKKKMRWLNANQAVINQNIANADTPNYQARELTAPDFSDLVEEASGLKGPKAVNVGLKTTNEAHFSGSGNIGTDGSSIETSEEPHNEYSPTGNSVVLEEEMMKMADNQMQYSLVTSLYRKNVGLLKMALGKGGNQ